MNVLRRAPLGRLLLGCGLAVALGISLTAIALALGSGPTPPPKPLAQAVHDALSGPAPEGFSADIKLTDHLIEGAQLAAGEQGGEGGLASSPLLNGASGRMWVSADGRVRLELQAERGDTQILYDGTTLELYDASTNTVYRLHPKQHEPQRSTGETRKAPPTLEQVRRSLAHLQQHADVSGARPTDVGGQPAYTVRLSPREGGSLLAGAELSFDANRGIPLRAAIYSTQSSSPVIELAASNVSYGPVSGSVFDVKPPADAKVNEIALENGNGSSPHSDKPNRPDVELVGHGPGAVAVLKQRERPGNQTGIPSGLERVQLGAKTAGVLKTELGTLLTFEQDGIRYLLLGSVAPAGIESIARGL